MLGVSLWSTLQFWNHAGSETPQLHEFRRRPLQAGPVASCQPRPPRQEKWRETSKRGSASGVQSSGPTRALEASVRDDYSAESFWRACQESSMIFKTASYELRFVF